MKRLKLKHGYHDAMVSQIRYRDRDIAFDVDLCSCCNQTAGSATIWFLEVRNFEHVRNGLEASRGAKGDSKYIDEIIGIARSDVRGYLVDLSAAGGFEIDAQGIFEA